MQLTSSVHCTRSDPGWNGTVPALLSAALSPGSHPPLTQVTEKVAVTFSAALSVFTSPISPNLIQEMLYVWQRKKKMSGGMI